MQAANITYKRSFIIIISLLLTIIIVHNIVCLLVITYSASAASPFSIYLLPEFFFIVVLHMSLLLFYIKNRITPTMTNSLELFRRVVIGCIFFLICLIVIMLNCLVPENNTYFCMNLFKATSFTEFLQLFAVACTIVILLFIYNAAPYYNALKIDHVFLILYVLLGGIFLLNSVDFLTFYLSLEIFSIPTYVLVTANQRSNFSTEAGLKYFIVGSFSSGIILFGLSLIYGATGCSTFVDAANIIEILSTNPTSLRNPTYELYIVGVFFFLCGLLLKMGIPPFHFWILDVYTGAPTIITLFLLTVPKIIIWGVLCTLLLDFSFINLYGIGPLLLLCVFSSFVFGNIPGLFQVKIKRLFIYSSLGTNGIFLLAILGSSTSAFVFYLIFYILGVTGFFAGVMLLRDPLTLKIKPMLLNFSDLHKQNPVVAYSFAAILFSLGGTPPFIGFYTKYYCITTVVSENGIASLLALFFTVISLFYYLRFLRWVFFTKSTESTSRTYVSLATINSFFLFYLFFSMSLVLLTTFVQTDLLNLICF